MDEIPIEVIGSPPPRRNTPSPRSKRRRSSSIAGGLIVVALAAIVIGSQDSPHRTTSPPTTPVATTASSAATTSAPPPTAPLDQRTITDRGEPFLATPTRTELIAREAGALVRIDLDAGRVVRTPVPLINSGAPTFVIAGAHSVLLRPLDNVAGYLVPDDAEARPLTGRLDQGTLWAFPGPAPGQVWVDSGDRQPGPFRLDLVAFEGTATVGSVALGNAVMPWGPDGTGSVVLFGRTGTFVSNATPTPTKVSDGDIFAAGKTTWLVRECDAQRACTMSTIDRRGGVPTAMRLDSLVSEPIPASGAISADGRMAAMVLGQTRELVVVNLIVGAQWFTGHYPASDPVWSLDGRYLFFVEDGRVEVFDQDSATTSALSVDVSGVSALAVRPPTGD